VTPRLARLAITAVTVAISLGLAPSAFAVSETGDAGDLPSTAQDLGSGAVSSIYGTFTGGADVDVYRVCLTGGGSFSASTAGATTLDTQLFLFDADGLGVYSNDDAGLGVHGSRLPAGHRFSPSAPGEYFIALSSFNNDPQSEAGEIFPDLFSSSLYPDGVVDATGMGGEEPIVGWSGPTRGPLGLYRISVTGTTGCDTAPPTVDLRSPADGVHVKQGAPLVVDFSCADSGGSGLASCVGSVADAALLDTSSLGETSVTVTARDNAGNETVVKHTVTVLDQTAPAITLTTPVEGATYEIGEQVLADYSCADEPNGSGLAACEGSVADGVAVDTGSLGQKAFTVDASDGAGNSASKSVSYTVVDTKAPSIVVTTPAPGAVYGVGEQVAADYSCSDDGSGIATCVGSVADGAALDTGSPGQKTFTVQATDNAGNPASRTLSYSVVDRSAPSISVTNPAAGAVYKLGEKVLAAYSCADEPNGSGVATCAGTLPVGARLDTSRVGPKSFEVRTTDNAGNSASKTVSYSVAYDFDGFLWPLENPPEVNRWKAGRSVPVRFSLGSYRGPVPVAAGYPKVATVACGAGAQPSGSSKARGSWKKRAARVTKRHGWTYMFVWKTDKKWAGSCREFVLKLDDGSVHRAQFQFVGRGRNRDRDDDDG
jgi:hypothetical protein